MLEELFFLLGLLNGALLIAIFLLAKYRRMDDVRHVGYIYLLLAVPAAYGIFLVVQEQKAWQYGIFLGIFLAYLALEALYDFILKLEFRNNWKLLVPYLCLYFAMNYSFVVMAWKNALLPGLILLGLFIVQIAINIWANHPALLAKVPPVKR